MTEQKNKNNEMEQQEKRLNENLNKIKNKILVFSGKGGVGKSTVAVSLAYKFSLEGYKVGLLDVDLHGPSIPTLLGIKDKNIFYDNNKLLRPIQINNNMLVVSIEAILEDSNSALIWRGPMKIGVIRQFIADVKWDELDYLIIDSPPGTGDEPLTVAQDIKGAKSIIVTTAQEVALSDVRKSIDFCNKVGMKIIGVVENMSSFYCPHCKKEIELFKGIGSDSLKEIYGVDILGKIPLFETLIPMFDKGEIFDIFNLKNPPYSDIISSIVSKIVR